MCCCFPSFSHGLQITVEIEAGNIDSQVRLQLESWRYHARDHAQMIRSWVDYGRLALNRYPSPKGKVVPIRCNYATILGEIMT